jgi:hypothetical protein
METPPWTRPQVVEHSRLLADSFRRWTGRPLIAGDMEGEALARALYHAPFVLVSHDTESDPLFNYANLAAQRLWELEWDAFVGMPSRKSAETPARYDRSQALARVLEEGFVPEYAGVRVSSTGRRFRIMGAIIWNVLDPGGGRRGQAATFRSWVHL